MALLKSRPNKDYQIYLSLINLEAQFQLCIWILASEFLAVPELDRLIGRPMDYFFLFQNNMIALFYLR